MAAPRARPTPPRGLRAAAPGAISGGTQGPRRRARLPPELVRLAGPATIFPQNCRKRSLAFPRGRCPPKKPPAGETVLSGSVPVSLRERRSSRDGASRPGGTPRWFSRACAHDRVINQHTAGWTRASVGRHRHCVSRGHRNTDLLADGSVTHPRRRPISARVFPVRCVLARQTALSILRGDQFKQQKHKNVRNAPRLGRGHGGETCFQRGLKQGGGRRLQPPRGTRASSHSRVWGQSPSCLRTTRSVEHALQNVFPTGECENTESTINGDGPCWGPFARTRKPPRVPLL